MDTPLSLERKVFLKRLSSAFDLQWSIISFGGFRHEGNGPRCLFEHMIEVCSLMIYLGDVLGYIVLDKQGFVDVGRSHGPFLWSVFICLEVTHLWCMRHPKHGSTPRDRRWISHGLQQVELHSFNPILRLDVAKAVYPGLSEDTILPDGLMIFPDYGLRETLLRQSKAALGMAVAESNGQSEPLCVARGINRVSVFVGCRKVREITGKVGDVGGRCYRQQQEVFLRLSTVSQCVESVADGAVGDEDVCWGGLRLYFKLEAPSGKSIYEVFEENGV